MVIGVANGTKNASRKRVIVPLHSIIITNMGLELKTTVWSSISSEEKLGMTSIGSWERSRDKWMGTCRTVNTIRMQNNTLTMWR